MYGNMFAQAFSLLCVFTFSVTASPYHSQSILRTNGECPAGVHIIGVRGTTEQPGFGVMEVIVKQLLSQLNGSDSYAIVYPAKGITLGPPWVSFPDYKKSEAEGVTNLTAEIIRFTDQCPDNGIVLMGYSQVSKTSRSGSDFGQNSVYCSRGPTWLETSSAVV